MNCESFLDGRVTLHVGDSREVVRGLADNSIDSVVTDPPYHLTGMSRPRPDLAGKQNKFASKQAQMSAGFMGKEWDGGDIAFRPELWADIYRVLKPGAHLVAFGGTRTYHRMACAIEDAGFEIRDQLAWVYGSGFPKSHDVSKGIDRAAGAERVIVGKLKDFARDGAKRQPSNHANEREIGICDSRARGWDADVTAPATDAARQWQAWGTALKPSWEPIVLARKPLSEKVIAANVLRWGTGGLNIDGCRVESDGAHKRPFMPCNNKRTVYGSQAPYQPANADGRWPANLVLTLDEDEYELKPFTSQDQKRELYRWLSENP